MGDEKYIEEAKNAEHYTNPADCAYEGYERILDYILSMCPEIELRFNGKEIQQVYPCWHDAVCHKSGPHRIFTECQMGEYWNDIYWLVVQNSNLFCFCLRVALYFLLANSLKTIDLTGVLRYHNK